jgi:hypothetical protein
MPLRYVIFKTDKRATVSVLSFKYHVFNALERSIRPEHVAYVDRTNIIVVFKSYTFISF